jgi:hypothetical protein
LGTESDPSRSRGRLKAPEPARVILATRSASVSTDANAYRHFKQQIP